MPQLLGLCLFLVCGLTGIFALAYLLAALHRPRQPMRVSSEEYDALLELGMVEAYSAKQAQRMIERRHR